MGTVCRVITEGLPVKQPKYIQFMTRIKNSGSCATCAELKDTAQRPRDFKNIELIRAKLNGDIMFAYNDDRRSGHLFVGYWNDGIVEPESE